MAGGRIGVPVLLAALENGDERLERTARRWRHFIAVGIVLSCLLTLGYIGWTLFALRDAWHTGDWTFFWAQVNGVWPLVVAGARFVGFEDHFTGQADAARTVREAAIKGDEQDAPIAEENSQLSQGGSTLFVGGVSYGPLKRPRDGRSVVPIVLICMAVFFAIVFGVILLSVGLSGAGKGTTQTEEIIGGILLLLLLLSIWWMVVAVRMRRGIIVTADESGISWKQVGWRTRRRHIAWHEAQAFFIVTQRRSTNWVKETTWVLMGASGALVWMASPEATEPQADSPHARFAALVAARTRLPLRDLSALAERLSKTGVSAEQRKALAADAIDAIKAARTQPEKAEAWLSAQRREQATEAVLSAHRSEQATKKGGLGWGCTVQLVLMMVIGLVYAGGWGLQHYQPHYYAGLLAQVHASTPLYHDDLSHEDGDWDVTSPTATDGGRVYKDGAYHVTGTKGYTAMSWPNFERGDAAVEVTARQIGTADADGVGLALRANEDGSDMVTFFVDSAGSWWLWHYRALDGNPDHEWIYLDDGHSNAIHMGSGAVNRLLVVMRGGQYLCYVNGQFVDSYYDDKHETPQSGHMGVFLNDGTLEGVFSNFTVYPAPLPSFWSTL